MNTIIPNSDFVGKIYGPIGNCPVKIGAAYCCYIITRITKKKVFARKLKMIEVAKPLGNGFFDKKNLGVMCIESPLTPIGQEILFSIYRIKFDNTELEYIRHKNMILFLINEDIKLYTLSPESSVFSKTSFS